MTVSKEETVEKTPWRLETEETQQRELLRNKNTARRQRRQDRERYRTRPETTSMETRGRVEDNVWTRAIIEETLGNVEGREEIFQPRSLFYPRVKLTMRFEQRKPVTNRPSREHFGTRDNGSI